MKGRTAYMNLIAGGGPLPNPDPPANQTRSDAMTYELNPSLFVEQGAAVMLRRARTARRSAREFELLREASTEREPGPIDQAA